MSVAARIKLLCAKEGSQSNFAEKTGIQRQTVSRIISRGTGIRSDTITAIAAAYPTLNLRWLVLGENPMWLAQKDDKSITPSGESTANEQMQAKMIGLLETKVRVLTRELKRLDPDLAKELGLE